MSGWHNEMKHRCDLSLVKLLLTSGGKQPIAQNYLHTTGKTALKMKEKLHESQEPGTSPSPHFHEEVTFGLQVRGQAAASANKWGREIQVALAL